MEGQSLIVFLIIGLIAGWLAGQIMKGGGYGIIGDLIVGVIGAFIGGWLWGVLHLPAARAVVADRRSSAPRSAPASCCSSSG